LQPICPARKNLPEFCRHRVRRPRRAPRHHGKPTSADPEELLKDQLNLTGGFWDLIGSLNDNFGTLGFVIIGVFVLSWVGSVIIYRVKGFDRLESATTTSD
jgi:hypothetical protein